MKLENVAIVVGHDSINKGAFSSYLGESEYKYNKAVANLVGCDVFTHSFNASYKRKMKATYSKLSHYDLTLELHFNAAANGSAKGSEALYFHTNRQGKLFAEKFAAFISKNYGTTNRGAKPLSNSNQRGFWAVASGIPTGLILEPFFGSNIESCGFWSKELYAANLREFILSL